MFCAILVHNATTSLAFLVTVFEPFEYIVNIVLVEHLVERLHETTEITVVH